VVHLLLVLLFPPLLLGVIGRTKAWCAGRSGAPVWQPYLDLRRLLLKGAVISRTTTWLFVAGPAVSLAALLTASLLVPLHVARAPLSFAGDAVAFACLLGLGRFFTMAAALDTGSSFEGMGASREAAFSALAEPALYLGLSIVLVPAGVPSLEQAWRALPWDTWGASHPALLAAALALGAVLLVENSRLPIDDPNTHLELTMIHEVMVLDHGGPDLAFITWGGALKLFLIGSLLIHLLLPIPDAAGWEGAALFLGGQILLAIGVGLLESAMARLRLSRVPQFLLGASVVALIGLIVQFYGGMR
jgi:formate hydrogenlyase subunit 4